MFDDLTSLRLLTLDDNGLTSLRSGVFDDLTSLTDLYIQRKRLPEAAVGRFRRADLADGPGLGWEREQSAVGRFSTS